MPFTTYLDTQILDWLLQQVPFTLPSSLYVGLSSTQPVQVTGTTAPYWNITELAGYGYAPDAVISSPSDWIPLVTEPLAGYELQNGNVVQFPASTGQWNAGQPIGYFFVKDAAGALNPGSVNSLFYGALVPPMSVTTGGIVLEFPVGQLTTELV